ncbi:MULTISPECIES: DUF937 domain-containing protein [unclassified Aureispira]|uniref:DUF937 domain-containing protein n=1 Tax=unclassified Aureispira TaxID=2649989 RepID=UPI000698559F|nr:MULTISPECIES: DUF937 domain-containing protein [unclassified Aureispira]WMX14134.1 DUF937 domain-containing protein [Aureispira sp. CCB-E]
MDLMNMFKQQMTNAVVSQMAQKVGLGGNEQQTSQAAQNVFTTLMGAVTKNASTPQGAESLNKALEKDHDGSVMNNLMSFLGSGPTQNVAPRAEDGNGILKHMLGNKQASVVQGLSQMNNMSPEATQSLMTTVAPMVMSLLGKAKQQQGFDASSITQFLGNQQAQTNNSQLSGIMSMLDSDGDGSVIDDLGNMLGGFFGK